MLNDPELVGGIEALYFILKYRLPCVGAKLEVQAHGHVVSDCGPKHLPLEVKRGGPVVLQRGGCKGWVSFHQPGCRMLPLETIALPCRWKLS